MGMLHTLHALCVIFGRKRQHSENHCPLIWTKRKLKTPLNAWWNGIGITKTKIIKKHSKKAIKNVDFKMMFLLNNWNYFQCQLNTNKLLTKWSCTKRYWCTWRGWYYVAAHLVVSTVVSSVCIAPTPHHHIPLFHFHLNSHTKCPLKGKSINIVIIRSRYRLILVRFLRSSKLI